MKNEKIMRAIGGIDDDIIETAMKDLKKAYIALSSDVERYIKEVKNERFVENSL